MDFLNSHHEDTVATMAGERKNQRVTLIKNTLRILG